MEECNNNLSPISHSENINELALALCKAQSEIEFAKKDSLNPFFKSKYADLSSVWDAIRSPLTKNGLSIAQLVNGMKNGYICLETMLIHSSGQWLKSEIQMKPIDDKPQTYGSTLTYARRYSLSAMVGVIQDDDDGNQASGLNKKGAHNEKEKNNKLNGLNRKSDKFHCSECNFEITEAENRFSINNFGVALCRTHQTVK